MHPREKVLGEIKYRQLRNEPIPKDTLVAAKRWGVLIPDNNIAKQGEPTNGKQED